MDRILSNQARLEELGFPGGLLPLAARAGAILIGLASTDFPVQQEQERLAGMTRPEFEAEIHKAGTRPEGPDLHSFAVMAEIAISKCADPAIDPQEQLGWREDAYSLLLGFQPKQ